MRTAKPWCLLVVWCALHACGDATPNSDGAGTPAPPPSANVPAPAVSPSDPAPSSAPSNSAPGGPIADDPLIDVPDEPAVGEPEACASELRQSELLPVKLAFAFDVSGSMGKGDYPYHDRALKWEPVVAAIRSFTSDTSSTGVFASLTFFPAEDDRCEVDNYTQPEVNFTALPSAAFNDAIEEVTPENEGDWRGGTPTMAVLKGTIEYVEEQMSEDPHAAYAIVLVTDGMPQDCDDEEDDIENVASVAAEVADRIPTYVIGVANPITDEEPEPPDSVKNLQLIAEQGKTGEAFLIDTGNPEQTSVAFREVIDTIRGNSLTCNITIPEPPEGQTFDQNLVNVTATSNGQPLPLGYSPDCGAADAWRYDDEAAPSVIELCPNVCAKIQQDPTATLDVEFGCVRRIGVSR